MSNYYSDRIPNLADHAKGLRSRFKPLDSDEKTLTKLLSELDKIPYREEMKPEGP